MRNEVVWRKKHPFAVVGSNTIALDKNGKKVRGRKYLWGTVDVENEVQNVNFRGKLMWKEILC